jgi:hypothetical protein
LLDDDLAGFVMDVHDRDFTTQTLRHQLQAEFSPETWNTLVV